MARIRSVHPGLWTDEGFVSLSFAARLFCIGLWNEADDFGIFEWKPLRLKMRLAPADAIDAAAILDEIEESGFIVRIERTGKPFGIVRNFRKYQRPKKPGSPLIDLDDEIIGVIGLIQGEGSGEPVPHSPPTGSRKSPQMEDGGGVGRRNGEKPDGFSKRSSAQKTQGFVEVRKTTHAINDLIEEIRNDAERIGIGSEGHGSDVPMLPAIRVGRS